MAPRPTNGYKHLLIVGQRTRKNMAFESEIRAMVTANVLDVEIIFSADECRPSFNENEIIYEDAPGRKGYIDKVIRDKSVEERLAMMIENGAFTYLCGTGALARTALDAIEGSLCGRFGEMYGKELLEKMVAENRLVSLPRSTNPFCDIIHSSRFVSF
jgi:sulfite reductase alpha subunit-like flavoprotein